VQPLVLSPKAWTCMPRLALASLPVRSHEMVVSAFSPDCSKVTVPATFESPRRTATIAEMSVSCSYSCVENPKWWKPYPKAEVSHGCRSERKHGCQLYHNHGSMCDMTLEASEYTAGSEPRVVLPTIRPRRRRQSRGSGRAQRHGPFTWLRQSDAVSSGGSDTTP